MLAPQGTTYAQAIEQAATAASELSVRPALGAVVRDTATGGFLVGASGLGISFGGQSAKQPETVTAMTPDLLAVVGPDGVQVPIVVTGAVPE